MLEAVRKLTFCSITELTDFFERHNTSFLPILLIPNKHSRVLVLVFIGQLWLEVPPRKTRTTWVYLPPQACSVGHAAWRCHRPGHAASPSHGVPVPPGVCHTSPSDFSPRLVSLYLGRCEQYIELLCKKKKKLIVFLSRDCFLPAHC